MIKFHQHDIKADFQSVEDGSEIQFYELTDFCDQLLIDREVIGEKDYKILEKFIPT